MSLIVTPKLRPGGGVWGPLAAQRGDGPAGSRARHGGAAPWRKPVPGASGVGFPRERWRKTMENLGKMRKKGGKPGKTYENLRGNEEKWKKMEENGSFTLY